MLPASARLNRPDDIRATVRHGVRAGRPSLVVHALAKQTPPSRAGFVVSKQVGGAVVRNRVKRRLRHLVASELAACLSPVDVVVRALPAAATEPARLGDDLQSAWRAAVHRAAVTT